MLTYLCSSYITPDLYTFEPAESAGDGSARSLTISRLSGEILLSGTGLSCMYVALAHTRTFRAFVSATSFVFSRPHRVWHHGTVDFVDQ